MTNRQVLQTDITQGVDEEITYNLTTTPFGSDPSNVVVTVWDVTHNNRVDVTSTVLTGSSSVTGDVITLPVLHSLEEGRLYRMEIKFTAGGQVFEPYVLITGEM